MSRQSAEGPTGPPPRLLALHILAAGLLGLAAAVAALGIMVFAGVLAPGAGLIGAIAPEAFYGHGTTLLLGGTAGLTAALVIRPHRRIAGAVVATLCLVSVIGLGTLVGGVLRTTADHGGAVDLVRTVLPSSAERPDVERFVYARGADGQALHMTVARPGPGRVPAPMLVWVHGGGWIGGSDLSRTADVRDLAAHGWLGVSVEYTLARPGHPTWDVDGPEIACALTQVVARAPSLGGDPARVVLAGDSAGGQLAISVAYRAAAGDQPSSCGGRVPVPRAVIGDYPAVDLVDGYLHGARSRTPSLDSRYLAVSYTGGTPAQVPDRYRAVSGATAITPAAPPTLVISPDRDVIVPPLSLQRFVRAARSGGIDATLVTMPFANHAFDSFGDGSLGQQASFSIMERWARDHVGPPMASNPSVITAPGS